MLVCCVALAGAAAEAVVRALDGYSVRSVRLVRALAPSAKIAESPGALAHRYVMASAVADGVRREWFDRPPDPLPRPALSPRAPVWPR